ncbi:adhesion G protein-coupled receptor E3-like [Rhineura floridana]|uniref:adhesion G protein-coupled receptor E3-like n=1 Tax=Rhineura floridana TaxID=261503 RepID=UPI002AC863F1|nr:adhesion G protein-coupled receptor E3-like [Rhineura floridana]
MTKIAGTAPQQQLSDVYWNFLDYTGLFPVVVDRGFHDNSTAKDCGSNFISNNDSSCDCKEGYRKMTSLETNQTSCEKIPYYHCKRDIVRENDCVRMCFSATKPENVLEEEELNISTKCKVDVFTDNLNLNNSFYCSVARSTFHLLETVCNGSLTTASLQDTVDSFEELVVNISLRSIETKEELVSVVIWGLEGLGLAAVEKALASPKKQSQTVVTNSAVIQTRIINEEDISKNETLHLEAQRDQMAIDPRALTDKTTQGPVAVAFMTYSGLDSLLSGTFLQDETLLGKSFHMNSKVVSASASRWTRNLSRPVNLILHHLENKVPQEKAICVHWNSAGRDGAWSPEGCRHLHSNTTHSECSCQYLSSYAVLMAPIPKQGDLILFIISYIGLIISLICLFLTIVTFLCCHSIQNSSTFIHLQLSICLFFADLFIIGIDKTYNKILCSVIAGTLQYLFLACFRWMFLEGVNLYVIVKNLKVANYSGASKCMKISMYLSGYGLPAMIVAISAAIAPRSYGTHYHCWINREKGFIWSFLGPVCAIIGINIVFFCLTLKNLHEKLASLNSEVTTLRNTRSLTFKAMGHVFILGLTWCLGLFQFGPLADVMAYLFTITNSVQGVFIFLVHCLLNRKVREIYWRLISCKKDIQPPVSEMSVTSVPISSPLKNEETTASGQQQKVEWEGEA